MYASYWPSRLTEALKLSVQTVSAIGRSSFGVIFLNFNSKFGKGASKSIPESKLLLFQQPPFLFSVKKAKFSRADISKKTRLKPVRKPCIIA